MFNKLSVFVATLVLSVLFITRVISSASAQDNTELTFDKAFNNYLISYEPYQEAHKEYLVARSQYLKFNTLKSRSDAREATLKMLETRDDVVLNYLIALREKVKETPGITDDQEELLVLDLNEQINWFSEHKSRLPSAQTPEDLAEDSDDAKLKFEEIKPILHFTLAGIAQGKMVDMDQRSVETFSALKEKVDVIRNDDREGYKLSSEKLQLIDRWLSESDNRLIRFQEKMSSAEGLVSLLDNPRDLRSTEQNYSKAMTALEEARQYLKGSLSFMNEVVREIKLAED